MTIFCSASSAQFRSLEPCLGLPSFLSVSGSFRFFLVPFFLSCVSLVVPVFTSIFLSRLLSSSSSVFSCLLFVCSFLLVVPVRRQSMCRVRLNHSHPHGVASTSNRTHPSFPGSSLLSSSSQLTQISSKQQARCTNPSSLHSLSSPLPFAGQHHPSFLSLMRSHRQSFHTPFQSSCLILSSCFLL